MNNLITDTAITIALATALSLITWGISGKPWKEGGTERLGFFYLILLIGAAIIIVLTFTGRYS